MNITDDLLRKYLDLFHQTYIETARKYIPQEKLNLLQRYSMIRGGTIGYVSTQFGAGYEYIKKESSGADIEVSSARIEDFFTKAPNYVRRLKPMFQIEGTNTTISSLTLQGTFPFRLTSPNSSVRFINVRFNINGWSRVVEFAEIYANRSVEFWSEKKAVERAKDEILQAIIDISLAEKQSLSLADYLSKFKKTIVLILGDYASSGRKRLNAIKEELIKLKYNPIFLDDIPDDPHYSLLQKVVAIGSVARFIVIDDSSKSGHIIEYKEAEDNQWVTIILRYKGSAGSYMTKGGSLRLNIMLEKTYTENNLGIVLKESVGWAEDKIKILQKGEEEIYPWRKDTEKYD